jgi:hypothetical protein
MSPQTSRSLLHRECDSRVNRQVPKTVMVTNLALVPLSYHFQQLISIISWSNLTLFRPSGGFFGWWWSSWSVEPWIMSKLGVHCTPKVWPASKQLYLPTSAGVDKAPFIKLKTVDYHQLFYVSQSIQFDCDSRADQCRPAGAEHWITPKIWCTTVCKNVHYAHPKCGMLVNCPPGVDKAVLTKPLYCLLFSLSSCDGLH